MFETALVSFACPELCLSKLQYPILHDATIEAYRDNSQNGVVTSLRLSSNHYSYFLFL